MTSQSSAYICVAVVFILRTISSASSQECNKNAPNEVLFPGLFVNESLLGVKGTYKGKVAILMSYTDTETGKTVNITKDSSKEGSTTSATTVTTPKDRNIRSTTCSHPNLCCDCCSTRYTWILPSISLYDGNMIFPAHSVSGDLHQVLTLGVCDYRSDIGSCKDCKCETVYGLTWILYFIPGLPWHPPVQFIPVRYPQECTCINPG